MSTVSKPKALSKADERASIIDFFCYKEFGVIVSVKSLACGKHNNIFYESIEEVDVSTLDNTANNPNF